MKVSEQRQKELYRAISDPIMDMRIKYYRNEINAKQVDDDLYRLEQKIAKQVWGALGISDEPANKGKEGDTDE